MQGSEIAIQQKDSASAPGWLERFSLIEKTPFLFFFGALLGFSSPGFDCSWLAWGRISTTSGANPFRC